MLIGVWVSVIIGLNEEINYNKNNVMGHYEDLWWEIAESIKTKGLKKEFDAQLKKMNHQPKHQYKDSRDKWSYAHAKVTNLTDKIISNKKAQN